MGILAECPICRRKQSTKQKICKCGEDLDKAKRAGRLNYWIDYRLPGGKQRRESVAAIEDLKGNSIDDARTAMSKRAVQKRENRLMEILPDSKMTFTDLADWYLKLSSVVGLKSFGRVKIALSRFNERFGEMIVADIKNIHLEEYQAKRLQEVAPATVDMELTLSKAMVQKAWDNDIVSDRPLKAFKRTEKKLNRGENARDRVVTVAEYKKLIAVALPHVRDMMIVAYNTGMRVGEIKLLRWAYIDWQTGFITLPADATKEAKAKHIPINGNVLAVLKANLPKVQAVSEGHHDYVFTFKEKPMLGPHGAEGSFIKACRDSGLPYGSKIEGGIIFKDFRRSVKTNMVAAGVGKVYRDIILGHSLKGMDVHYIKPSKEDLSKAMWVYTKWLDAQSADVDQSVDQAGIKLI